MKIEDLIIFYFSRMDINQLITDYKLPFDIYIKLNSKLAVYKKSGEIIKSKDITRLHDNHFHYVFVHNRNMKIKKSYAEKNLQIFLNMKTVTTLFKTECIYEALLNITEDLYTDPSTPGIPERLINVMQPAAEFIAATRDAFKAILTINRHEAYNTTHPVNVAMSLIALAHKTGIAHIPTLAEAGTGGLLHDIGKISIPASIINKKTSLTEAEWELIREHPLKGVEIARKYNLTGDTGLSIIRNHHEKRNGQGYPAGLKGEHKGDLAEMTSITDVFDAITSDKPYSMARPPVDGANFLLTHMEEYDKHLVLQFIKLLSE